MPLEVGDVFVIMRGMISDGMIVALGGSMDDVLCAVREAGMRYAVLFRVKGFLLPMNPQRLPRSM
jgi:hypothetical protein